MTLQDARGLFRGYGHPCGGGYRPLQRVQGALQSDLKRGVMALAAVCLAATVFGADDPAIVPVPMGNGAGVAVDLAAVADQGLAASADATAGWWGRNWLWAVPVTLAGGAYAADRAGWIDLKDVWDDLRGHGGGGGVVADGAAGNGSICVPVPGEPAISITVDARNNSGSIDIDIDVHGGNEPGE